MPKLIQPLILFSALANLMRLRILFMVLIAASLGFVLAFNGDFHLSIFLWMLLSTALLSGGSCALNCYIERNEDALMPRTRNRPIPRGVIQPRVALFFGLTLVLAGLGLAYSQINALCALLGLLAVFIYLIIYTPAKHLTWLNTPIGAVPGAIPPLIGWAAARGQIETGAWVLFAMLFLWQHVHFLPIAWLFKDDYKIAGFRMLAVLDARGEKTICLTVVAAIMLFPVSISLYLLRAAGLAYCVSASLLGMLLILGGARFYCEPSRAAARTVLILCLFYLPVLLSSVLFDRCFLVVSN